MATPTNTSPESMSTSETSGIGIPIFISLTFFGLACASPALVFSNVYNDEHIMSGFEAFLLGPLAALYNGQFAWCANPLLLVGMRFLFSGKWKNAISLNALALLITMNTFLLFYFPTYLGPEGGSSAPEYDYLLQSFHIGFYLWIASIVTLGVAATIRLRQHNRSA